MKEADLPALLWDCSVKFGMQSIHSPADVILKFNEINTESGSREAVIS